MIGSVTTLGLSGVSIGDLYGWSVSPTVTIGHWPALFDVRCGNSVFIIRNGTISGIDEPFEPKLFTNTIDVPCENITLSVNVDNIEARELFSNG